MANVFFNRVNGVAFKDLDVGDFCVTNDLDVNRELFIKVNYNYTDNVVRLSDGYCWTMNADERVTPIKSDRVTITVD